MTVISKEIILSGATQIVAASQTKLPVSHALKVLKLTGPLVVDVVVSATTVAAAVTLYLQTSNGGDSATWTDLKSTSVANSFTGTKTQSYFVELAADQTYYPLRAFLRVVATTGAGDTITITSVKVAQDH